MSRPLVLLSNDDGYTSEGIRALREAFSATCDVVLVAPETEQSAASHALTLHRPLRIREVEKGIVAVDGTPADCVYLALHAGKVLPRFPDIVISGLNNGPNLGQDVFYSGTVAAAREGALQGIPAMATSAHPKADLAKTAALVVKLATQLMAKGPPPITAAPKNVTDRRRAPLLNFNMPKDWNGKLIEARLGARFYDSVVDIRTDPRGREYCWIGGPGVQHELTEGMDTTAYYAGIATLSSLALDMSDSSSELVRAVIQGV